MSAAARRSRPQRSVLAVPATSERLLPKAAASAADAVFIDLEDAVAPAMKEAARAGAVAALASIDWGGKRVAVRINGLDTKWGHRDLLALAEAPGRLDTILLPKVGSPDDVLFVDRLLSLFEHERGTAPRVGIEAIIETARGVAHVEAIAAACERLEGMVFGVGDYTLEMGTRDRVFGAPSARYAVLTAPDAAGARARHWNDAWHFAMARIANACRAYGLRAIDGPFTDFADTAGFAAAAGRAASLGFRGKWAVHPRQVAPANEAFSPSAEEIAWAEQVLAVLDRTTGAGRGAAAVDGVLVDMAHRRLARAILDEAALITGREPAPRDSAVTR
jgi:malyl-CoA/(S)-citramalyl-CoA lyase